MDSGVLWSAFCHSLLPLLAIRFPVLIPIAVHGEWHMHGDFRSSVAVSYRRTHEEENMIR